MVSLQIAIVKVKQRKWFKNRNHVTYNANTIILSFLLDGGGYATRRVHLTFLLRLLDSLKGTVNGWRCKVKGMNKRSLSKDSG